MEPLFTWDPAKGQANFAKHRVAFEEALSVFRDPLARIFADEDHSETEAREILVGYSASGRLLVVSFTEGERVVRVISAREATRRERRQHEEAIER